MLFIPSAALIHSYETLPNSNKKWSIGSASHFKDIFILILEKSKYRAPIFCCFKIFNTEKTLFGGACHFNFRKNIKN